jgi:uncharacterized coiled-coil protein SlyX
MTIGDREGLIARIQQLRRPATDREGADGDASDQQPDRIQALETRIKHLEQVLEGLQDSVHRESERHTKLIAELQAQIQPGTIRAALAQDARDRGL